MHITNKLRHAQHILNAKRQQFVLEKSKHVRMSKILELEKRVFEAFRRIGNGEAAAETVFIHEGGHTYAKEVKKCPSK